MGREDLILKAALLIPQRVLLSVCQQKADFLPFFLYWFIIYLTYHCIDSCPSQSACAFSTRASNMRKRPRKRRGGSTVPECPSERSYAQVVKSCCSDCPEESKRCFMPVYNSSHPGRTAWGTKAAIFGRHKVVILHPYPLRNIQLRVGRPATGNDTGLVSTHCSF